MRIVRHAALILALSTAGMALPANAQIAPATPEKIAEAVSACMVASTVDGVDEAQLTDEGWAKAAVTEDGKPVDHGLSFYGKSGNHSILLLDPQERQVCVVTARITDPSAYQGVVDAIDALADVKPIEQDKFDITFLGDDRMIFSQISGTPDKPGVRIFVSAMESEK